MNQFRKTLRLSFLIIIACVGVAQAQTDEDEKNAIDPASVAVKQLASRDALIRQQGAEELARLEATDQRRLIEGYRLQEKNARVKLALDWALYRFGKTESLFAVVAALDSSRAQQAFSYLTMLDNPEPLYLFLERTNGNTQIKLLEVLAKIGDAVALEKIRPFMNSFDPKIAEAAKLAAREIEGRLGETPSDKSTRPRRTVAEEEETSP